MHELMPKVKEVWEGYFPFARAGNFNRLDKGRRHRYGKRFAADGRPSEAAFLKCRRVAVSALREGRVPRRVSELVSMDILLAWTPGHDAELGFNRRKRHARRIEAYHAKSLLPDEVDEELVNEALANKDTLTKARRTRANHEARQGIDFQGRLLALVEFTGQAIHIPDNIRTALLDRWVAALGLSLTTVASAVLVLMPPIADPASELLRGAMLARLGHGTRLAGGLWHVHWADAEVSAGRAPQALGLAEPQLQGLARAGRQSHRGVRGAAGQPLELA